VSPPPHRNNRPNYSGKHRAHGLLFLAITDERGNLLWISAARPGRSSEITTARHNKITARLRAAGLGALADLGFTGLDDDSDNPVIVTGRKATRGHSLTAAEKEANKPRGSRTDLREPGGAKFPPATRYAACSYSWRMPPRRSRCPDAGGGRCRTARTCAGRGANAAGSSAPEGDTVSPAPLR
jgi:hypothetical protein